MNRRITRLLAMLLAALLLAGMLPAAMAGEDLSGNEEIQDNIENSGKETPIDNVEPEGENEDEGEPVVTELNGSDALVSSFETPDAASLNTGTGSAAIVGSAPGTAGEGTAGANVEEDEPLETATEGLTLEAQYAESNGDPSDAGSDSLVISDVFPDEVLQGIICELLKKNSGDTVTEAELSQITGLTVIDVAAQNLNGIEYLTGLKTLHIAGTLVPSVDVSMMPQLEKLIVTNNPNLASVTLGSNHPSLKHIECDKNGSRNGSGARLTQLTVEDLPALTSLSCCFDSLESLTLSDLPNLEYLECVGNRLTGLNLAGLNNLKYLGAYANKISTLDLSACERLNAKRAELSGPYDGTWTFEQIGETGDYLYYIDRDSISAFIQERWPEICISVDKTTQLKFTPFEVTFDLAGGSGSAPAQTVSFRKTVAKPANPTPPSGKKFDGWYAQGSDTAYDFASPVTSNLTLAARYSAAAPAINYLYLPGKSAKATVYVGQGYQINLVNIGAKKFKSAKKSIAAVSGSGWVTPKKAGKVKITVTLSNKKKRTLTLNVVDPTQPQSIRLTAATTVLSPGQKLQLNVVPTWPYPSLYSSKYVAIKSVKSSKKKVASVTKGGVVTAKKKGKTKITVTTKNKKKATITIIVR